MVMEKRVSIVLDRRQIEKACEAAIAARLRDDEAATAVLMVGDLVDSSPGTITCHVNVSKKRPPRVRTTKA